MKHIEQVVMERALMTATAMGEVSPSAKLLKDGESLLSLGLLGWVEQQRGEEVHCIAVYDGEILNSMGLPFEEQRKMKDAFFMRRAFVDMDSVYLARMHQLCAKEDTEFNALSLKEQYEKSVELCSLLSAAVSLSVKHGLDLPTIFAEFIKAEQQRSAPEEPNVD
jgi:hypothetical protein